MNLTRFQIEEPLHTGKHLDKQDKERGVALLFLIILILAVLMGLALGLASTVITQVQLLGGLGDSVAAFYAAETGLERVLYDDKTGVDVVATCGSAGNCADTLPNGASYEVIAYSGGGCSGTDFCIDSEGFFEDARRKITVER